MLADLVTNAMFYNKLRFGEKMDNLWNVVEVLDEHGQPTVYLAVRTEFDNAEAEAKFAKLAQGRKLIGLSSYQTFPKPLINPHQSTGAVFDRSKQFIEKYKSQLIFWCHCFRNPKEYLPSSLPYILLSETDQYCHFNTLYTINEPKEYDVVISMPGGEWNAWVRKLDICKKWVQCMLDKFDLKILVIGNDRRKDFDERVAVIDFQRWADFLKRISRAKFLFCCSGHDASPRILVEALALNVPVLVNENILGGWKYINEYTGDLFCPEENMERKLTSFIQQLKHRKPRQWMQENMDVEANKVVLAHALNTLQDMRFSTLVDHVLYINLANRVDRDQAIKKQLHSMGIGDFMYTRIDAVLHQVCGHLGCTMSHIKALEHAIAMNYDNVLILEDDFEFVLPKERCLFILNEFKAYKGEAWNVFMFSAYYKEYHKPTVVEHEMFRHVKWGSTTAGYWVNGQDYMRKLLANFQASKVRLEEEVSQFAATHPPGHRLLVTDWALDVKWRSLQEQDLFYLSEPCLGQQSCSPSSIMM